MEPAACGSPTQAVQGERGTSAKLLKQQPKVCKASPRDMQAGRCHGVARCPTSCCVLCCPRLHLSAPTSPPTTMISLTVVSGRTTTDLRYAARPCRTIAKGRPVYAPASAGNGRNQVAAPGAGCSLFPVQHDCCSTPPPWPSIMRAPTLRRPITGCATPVPAPSRRWASRAPARQPQAPPSPLALWRAKAAAGRSRTGPLPPAARPSCRRRSFCRAGPPGWESPGAREGARSV